MGQGASLVAQMVKNLSVIQETNVQSLTQENLLEKGMATHSSILAWRILWTEEPGRLQSLGLQCWAQLSGQHFHTFKGCMGSLCIFSSIFFLLIKFAQNLIKLINCLKSRESVIIQTCKFIGNLIAIVAMYLCVTNYCKLDDLKPVIS